MSLVLALDDRVKKLGKTISVGFEDRSMNGVVHCARGVGRLAVHRPQQTFKGCLLMPLNKSGKLIVNHPLDTNLEDYFQVINEIVIPDCMDVAPDIKGYGERIKHLLSYTNPAFSDCWNFGVELQYRLVAPQEHQTEENLTKIRILRACMDLTFTMSAVLDDIIDGSDERRRKPAWHTFCEGGRWAGLYDSVVEGYLPFHILSKHFRDHPGYTRMLETFGLGNLKMLIGETIDVIGQGVTTADAELHSNVINYKAGHFVAMQPILGLLHAGLMDEKIICQAMEIYYHLGNLIQTWDDFNDYYSSVADTGKPPCDFLNGGTTWVSATAMEHFDPRQMSVFKECYGSGEPWKVEAVKRLYDEIEVPQLYLNHMREYYLRISPMIQAIPDRRVREACYSMLDWLIGDVSHNTPQHF